MPGLLHGSPILFRKSHSPSNIPAITRKQAQVLTNDTTSTLVSVRSEGLNLLQERLHVLQIAASPAALRGDRLLQGRVADRALPLDRRAEGREGPLDRLVA